MPKKQNSENKYRKTTFRKIFHRKAVADTIKDHPGVRIFHNCDDFLLNDEERYFHDRNFTKKRFWFSNGGHLGNLYYIPVQQAITGK